MTAPVPSERQVQRAVLQMIGVCFPKALVHHSPNGAHLAGDGAARFKQIGALLGDGMKRGWPDLIVLWKPRSGALIEVKRPETGRLSDEQKAVHQLLHDIEWPVVTVTDEIDAFLFLRAAGAPWSGVTWRPQ
jgi:hypothetical protein